MQNPRQIAAKVLEARLRGEEYTETLLDAELAAAQLSPADRGLCHELVCGCVRQQAALDWLITRKATPGREQKPGLQILLRLGLYQIFWLDRIPGHAAVNETVELAKRRGFTSQAGFVNAVLRGYLRELDVTKQTLANLKTVHPAIGWSQPEWLVERWQKQFGPEKTLRLLEWNNTPPKTYARLNTLKTDAAKLLAVWKEEGVEAEPVQRDWLPENLVFELKSHPHLAKLQTLQDGWFYLQDPSTLLAVQTLAPKPGETVLDLCAAPGGKTTLIAQLMGNKGKVIAHDPIPDRTKLIEQNCQRLGVTCVERIDPFSFGGNAFDRVLVDAPCSNTGVLRRRVDLRWRIQPKEIARLRQTQLNLLTRAADALKPGGVLVYSTCSLEPEENTGVVKEFLAGRSDLTLESERQLTPFSENTDGAYVAKLVKR